MTGEIGAEGDHTTRSSLIEAIAAVRAAIADVTEEDAEPLVVQLRDLALSYAEITPVVTVSRCPFTAIPVRYPMDVEGLDGPYWDAAAPIRYLPERPATVVAVTGAVAANEKLEPTTFERRLGPDHHVIHPSILGQPGTRAVLSSVAIGPHRILLTTYFQHPVTISLGRVPELGTDRELKWGPDRLPPIDADRDRVVLDASQHAWLDDDRIGWIDSEDEDWIVQTGRERYPYAAGATA